MVDTETNQIFGVFTTEITKFLETPCTFTTWPCKAGLDVQKKKYNCHWRPSGLGIQHTHAATIDMHDPIMYPEEFPQKRNTAADEKTNSKQIS